MNLRHLRAFAAIADADGFARAAARLNLSQPALSRQIQALQAEFGVPLFDRVGRRARLTAEGEDLLRRSRRLLAEADALGQHARALEAGDTGILRLGATPQMIENLLAEFLARYRRRHHGIEVHLVEDGGARLHERVARGDVHLAIAPADSARLASLPLLPICVIAAVPPRHRLARRRVAEVAELADEPLLLLRREFGSREWFDVACEAARIRPRVLLESAAPHTLMALAATGYGVAILPSNAAVPRGRLRLVPLVHRGAAIGRWAKIAWGPERFLPRYAERFADELVAECRQGYPGRDLVRRAPPLPPP